MAKKKKSLLKKIGKAAAIAGALYVGAKGLGRKNQLFQVLDKMLKI